jgi:CCR4-NOT transcriptional regulation complex NOT5 subunit
MASKKERLKREAEAKYKKELEKLETMEDEEEADDEEIIVIRGAAKDRLLATLERLGMEPEEAEEVAEDVEEEVEGETDEEEEGEGDEVESGDEPDEVAVRRAAKKAPAKKVAGKRVTKREVVEESMDDDPKPPAGHRFFR